MNNTEEPPKVVKNLLYNLFRYNRLDFTTNPDYYLYLTDRDMEELKTSPTILDYDPIPIINDIGSNIYDISNSVYNTMDKLLNFTFPKPTTTTESNAAFNSKHNRQSSDLVRENIEKSTILTDHASSDDFARGPQSILDFFTDKRSPFYSNDFQHEYKTRRDEGKKTGWSYTLIKTYTDEDGNTVTERKTRDIDGNKEVTIEKSQPSQSSPAK